MPIRDFLQDANGDLAVVNGDFARSGGDSVDANQAAVKQAIAIRVKFFLAEYFLDESIGVDWLGQILVKNPDQVVVVELIREVTAGRTLLTVEHDMGVVFGLADKIAEGDTAAAQAGCVAWAKAQP